MPPNAPPFRNPHQSNELACASPREYRNATSQCPTPHWRISPDVLLGFLEDRVAKVRQVLKVTPNELFGVGGKMNDDFSHLGI